MAFKRKSGNVSVLVTRHRRIRAIDRSRRASDGSVVLSAQQSTDRVRDRLIIFSFTEEPIYFQQLYNVMQ